VASVKITRAQARTNQIVIIKEVSRRLISENGVAGLSLREVAREMGLVSSALYRYFASRDELLTALILDAYNDLGAAVERSAARHADSSPRDRWRWAARSIRKWAKRHPHDYALIYGTPVPDYVAPPETIDAATRVTAVLSRILADHWSQQALTGSPPGDAEYPLGFLETERLGVALANVPSSRYVRALMAWTQIFGFVSFELFGHYVGSVRNADVMFERVVEELADWLEFDD
jgi:AcrR family transcriptional regulator